MTDGSTAADLRAECDAARARVAQDPRDAAAAEALFEAVRRAAREQPVAPAPARAVATEVAQAARLLDQGESEQAEILLRRYLATVRNEPDAMLLMANIAAQCGFPDNAARILRRSLELNPDRVETWLGLARVIHDAARTQDRAELVDEALGCLDCALRIAPAHEEVLGYRAALLVQVRRLDEGHAAFEALVQAHPDNAPSWINFAHLLKTRGFFGEAVAAYRTAIALDRVNGTAWWLFADLKLARFFPADIERMEAALDESLTDEVRTNLHFALAAAYDQAKAWEAAARHLHAGNALRLAARPHDVAAMREATDAAIAVYSPAFFATRAEAGDPATDPIFVLGMPRSGSTLLEQILASHSRIEGTAELFAVQQIEMELFRERGAGSIEAIVGTLGKDVFAGLGRRYLELTRFHRRTDRPHFIDKNPGNWRQVGLIHLMLPNARIIDIRRNPMDCCFANYFQHFMVGVNYSYGLAEVASYYGEYVRLMRHFDAALPGRVHRVIYEDLVEDTEAEVRRLFAYLGLPFEDACLRFFETDRPVHTPSSEQVRQPINRAGIGKWRNYAAWIGDLEASLGDLRGDWRR